MMTRTQKTTILEMRAEGITYKAIAAQMGMSLGSVKMFVSRHNRADDRRCEQCGKLLPKGAGASQRFCSTKCKNVWWKAHPGKTAGDKLLSCTCTICGKTDTSHPDLEFRYCSRCQGYHCYCQEHISNHTHIQ